MVEENDDLITKAEKAAARLETANKVMEELVKRQEAADARNEARRLLGGQSNAGNKPAELSPEEKTKIDMKNYFKGTAIEQALKQ